MVRNEEPSFTACEVFPILTCINRSPGDPHEPSTSPAPRFDAAQARKGYALNKMCYSFNDEANRKAFAADEEGYCTKYALNAQQREAIRERNVLADRRRGNVYYLAKFAGIFGLDVQDIGAQQTGMSKDAFKAMLVEQGKQ